MQNNIVFFLHSEHWRKNCHVLKLFVWVFVYAFQTFERYDLNRTTHVIIFSSVSCFLYNRWWFYEIKNWLKSKMRTSNTFSLNFLVHCWRKRTIIVTSSAITWPTHASNGTQTVRATAIFDILTVYTAHHEKVFASVTRDDDRHFSRLSIHIERKVRYVCVSESILFASLVCE